MGLAKWHETATKELAVKSLLVKSHEGRQTFQTLGAPEVCPVVISGGPKITHQGVRKLVWTPNNRKRRPDTKTPKNFQLATYFHLESQMGKFPGVKKCIQLVGKSL